MKILTPVIFSLMGISFLSTRPTYASQVYAFNFDSGFERNLLKQRQQEEKLLREEKEAIRKKRLRDEQLRKKELQHEKELAREKELQRERELKREKELQSEKDLIRKKERQRERELENEKRLARERKLNLEKLRQQRLQRERLREAQLREEEKLREQRLQAQKLQQQQEQALRLEQQKLQYQEFIQSNQAQERQQGLLQKMAYDRRLAEQKMTQRASLPRVQSPPQIHEIPVARKGRPKVGSPPPSTSLTADPRSLGTRPPVDSTLGNLSLSPKKKTFLQSASKEASSQSTSKSDLKSDAGATSDGSRNPTSKKTKGTPSEAEDSASLTQETKKKKKAKKTSCQSGPCTASQTYPAFSPPQGKSCGDPHSEIQQFTDPSKGNAKVACFAAKDAEYNYLSSQYSDPKNPIQIDGSSWPSLGHYVHCKSFAPSKNSKGAELINTPQCQALLKTSGEETDQLAKTFNQKSSSPSHTEAIQSMCSGDLAKLQQMDPSLLEKTCNNLNQTHIIHNSTSQDDFWGIGPSQTYDPGTSSSPGNNFLGRIHSQQLETVCQQRGYSFKKPTTYQGAPVQFVCQ